ncbi:MAG: M28 family peptidase [Candidatus Neomarinimicrobiota bacterium]
MNFRNFIIPLIGLSYLVAQDPIEIIDEIIQQVNADSLIQYVNYLSGVDSVLINNEPSIIKSRHQNFPGNEIAAIYLENELKRFGLITEIQQYSSTGKNIIATQFGRTHPDLKYILCAHYDSMPESERSPGADDNASGTAVVLEAARILSKYSTDYSIVYALWDEEEQGALGSYYYAENEAAGNSDQILGVINIDMVGWDGNNDGILFVNSREIGNSIELSDRVIEVNTNYSINLNPQVLIPGYGSDNLPFWAYGFSAIGIEEHYGIDWNPYYHNKFDNVSQFNMSYFHRNAKLSIGVLATFAQIDQVTLTAEREEIIWEYRLLQNYPNPFNPITQINYQLLEDGKVILRIYDLLGREVRTLVNSTEQAGYKTVKWDSKDSYGQPVSGGVYLYHIEAGSFSYTKKMILLK